ncbi:MAG TPA: hypothetical protein VJQ83_08065 [Tepidiformaceae bacterium]|nr:hypothetical protein [Tepidiformaceae bacterium]
MIIEIEDQTALGRSQDRHGNLMWCPSCRRQVDMVTPEQAGRIAGVSTRTIYRWVEAEAVHFIEDCGHPLICVPGLFHRTAASEAGVRQIAGRGHLT